MSGFLRLALRFRVCLQFGEEKLIGKIANTARQFQPFRVHRQRGAVASEDCLLQRPPKTDERIRHLGCRYLVPCGMASHLRRERASLCRDAVAARVTQDQSEETRVRIVRLRIESGRVPFHCTVIVPVNCFPLILHVNG